uniref:Salivary lipocalin n=1 Tax=Triatoma infestans TaxID=30076 RepID=A6YPN6_TRIIF|nr:salivary lipocalin [Triatoma infestans]
MKGVFIVAFFGIFVHAFAQFTSTIQSCPKQSTMQNLNPSDFFLGAWVVTHARSGPQLITCRTYKTSVEKKTTITFDGDGYYGDGDAVTYYQVRCKGKKNNGGNGKFSLSCTRQRPSISGTSPQNSITEFNLELSVIDTDYGQYAIVQTCTKYPTLGVTKDNILVLHRNKNALKPDIKTIFQQKIGSSLDTYITRKDSECKVA